MSKCTVEELEALRVDLSKPFYWSPEALLTTMNMILDHLIAVEGVEK